MEAQVEVRDWLKKIVDITVAALQDPKPNKRKKG